MLHNKLEAPELRAKNIMNRIRWSLYTLLIGLVPFIARFFTCINSTMPFLYQYIFNPIDFAILALVLICSYFQEMRNLEKLDKNKTILGETARTVYPFAAGACIFTIAYILNSLYGEELRNALNNNNLSSITQDQNNVNNYNPRYVLFLVESLAICFFSGILSFSIVRKLDLAKQISE